MSPSKCCFLLRCFSTTFTRSWLNLRCSWCCNSRCVGCRDCWLCYDYADGVHFLSIKWSVNEKCILLFAQKFLVIVHQISDKLMPFLPDGNFCIHLLCCFASNSSVIFDLWNCPCSLKMIASRRASIVELDGLKSAVAGDICIINKWKRLQKCVLCDRSLKFVLSHKWMTRMIARAAAVC